MELRSRLRYGASMRNSFLIAARILAVLVLTTLPVMAQEAAPSSREIIDGFLATSQRLEASIEAGTIKTDEIDAQRLSLEEKRTTLAEIVARSTEQLAPLLAERDALGPPPAEGASEPPELASQRKRLGTEIDAIESIQKRAAQAEARARTLADRLATMRRDQFTRQLMTRGPMPLTPERITKAIGAAQSYLATVSAETQNRLKTTGAMGSLLDRLGLPGLLAAMGLVIAIGLRRWTVSRLVRAANMEKRRSRQVAIGFGLTLARLLIPALALALFLAGLSQAGIVGPAGETLLEGAAIWAALMIGAYGLGGAFFSPGASSLRFSRLSDTAARYAHRWLIAVAGIVGLDRLLVLTGERAGLPIEALSLVNFGLLCLGAVALWQFVTVTCVVTMAADPGADTDHRPDPDDAEPDVTPPMMRLTRAMRVAARVIAVLAPALAALGYFSASRYVFYAPVFSGAIIGLCVLLYHVAADLTQEPASSEIDRTTTRQPLIPVAVATVLIMAAAPVLALIWGADTADLSALWSRTLDGFKIGEVTLSPIDFLVFLLVFVVGYMLTRLIQGILRRSVLPLTPMDAGGRSAVLAGVGYIGVILSGLIAISSTGLDLSNLAIVAGALSVGIGFGLQNIVNNFVSGIILLIERPIKTGDWVEIGGNHGYVKQVNVRSTEIETFDRASLFVPNADLMSGTVINWTHTNSHGRLIVPIGAAYGSDARQIEKILLEIARAHPMLLRRPAPYVLFSGFGADSIDFEIRGVLRDVNWIMNVASDIRYEVYEKFAEAGIEIPFAQRDLHIKNIDELGGTIRAAVRQSKGNSDV